MTPWRQSPPFNHHILLFLSVALRSQHKSNIYIWLWVNCLSVWAAVDVGHTCCHRDGVIFVEVQGQHGVLKQQEHWKKWEWASKTAFNRVVNIFIASCQPIYTIRLQLLNAQVLKTVIYSELNLTLCYNRLKWDQKQEKLNVEISAIVTVFCIMTYYLTTWCSCRMCALISSLAHLYSKTYFTICVCYGPPLAMPGT